MGLHKGLFVEGSVALQEIHNSIFWSLHAAEIAGSNLVEIFCSLDILLELKEVNGQLEGHFCGKETFFSVQTIERMVKHFKVTH